MTNREHNNLKRGLELQAEAGLRLFELLEPQATGSGRGYNLVGRIVGILGSVLVAAMASR